MAEKDGYEEGLLRARPAAEPIGEAPVGLRPLGIDAPPARGPPVVRAGRLPRGAPLPAGGPAPWGGRELSRRRALPPVGGGRGRARTARPDLARVHVGRHRRGVRSRRRRRRPGPGGGVSPLRDRPGARGRRGLFGRGPLRALPGDRERRFVRARARVLAGFMAPAGQEGSPRIFVSHGTHDATCSRSTRAAAGSSPGSGAPTTRYATASSRAATRSRPGSGVRPRAGSPRSRTEGGPPLGNSGALASVAQYHVSRSRAGRGPIPCIPDVPNLRGRCRMLSRSG